MDTVIEVSSSPEPEPSSRKAPNVRVRPKSRKASRPPKRDDLIIEITDSEEENDALALKKRSAKGKVAAGPSRLTPSRPVPPQHANTATASSSSNSAPTRLSLQKTKSSSTPLFLPDDEENENLQHNLKPAPGPATSPKHHPDVQVLVPLVAPEPIPQTEPIPPLPAANPIDKCVAQVLEIIPDVQLDHLVALITKHLAIANDNVLEAVLFVLFEDPTYPKVDRKGKRKRVEGEPNDQGGDVPKPTVDYTDRERNFRGSVQYIDMALEQLLMDFPYIPKPHVRKTFLANNGLYVPTYIFLDKEKKSGILPYSTKTLASRVKGKGKAQGNADFEAERNWLVLHKQTEAANANPDAKNVPDEQADEENGDGIECGCCFATYSFHKMIQCPDAHLFCSSCMTSYASGLLGAHNPNLVCMDQSGCKLAFPLSELRRFLTPKLMELYNRVTQTKDIEAAGLENLEECPFCEYKVVIENEQEKLFRCENTDCAAVTCRGCKKLDHLPKSCKEMEEDKHLDGRHSIEEAMTRALMRNCPKCQKAFIKEMGCNKMTCPNCHTMSCYICRQIVVGYDHFESSQNNASVKLKKCALWDPVEQRHHEEVTAAAKKALADYKQQHPDVDEKEIKVDLPVPVPAVPPAGAMQNPIVHFAAPRMPVQPHQPLRPFQQLARQNFNQHPNFGGPVAAAVPARKRRRQR